ncbi:hypothetical protein [Erwinia phyllosphaerae]|uniref:hypothetical protein n=1 Tax=Erwinia phyllosphaerae TaxID=2853256 RepID=UPI001FEDCAAC|nr:hypothetical protein [Erwinia phyllosphaerae]MBV4366310.1 hypothetical protein [Erwinia phyllosphaerae]
MNKEKIMSFFNLATPVKLVISSLITALSGTTYFAIINKVAMYWYSIENGFRLPVEGSPFITIAISSVTFLTMMGATLLFLLLFAFSHFMKKFTIKLEGYHKKKIQLHKEAGNKIRIFLFNLVKPTPDRPIDVKFIILISIFMGVISCFIVYFSSQSPPLKAYIILPFLSVIYPVLISSPFLPHRKAILSIMTLLFMIISPFLLLDSGNYKKILSSINYGGYSSIDLHIGDKAINDAKLVFRSSEYIFICGNDKNKITEIPIKDVTSIDYIVKEEVNHAKVL